MFPWCVTDLGHVVFPIARWEIESGVIVIGHAVGKMFKIYAGRRRLRHTEARAHPHAA